MKTKLLYFLGVVMIALIGFFGVHTAMVLRTIYQQKQTDQALIVFQMLGTLMDKTAQEEFESALFYGVKGVNYLDRLEASRQDVDRVIAQLQKQIANGSAPQINSLIVDRFVRQMHAIRTRIDTLDSSVEHFFGNWESPGPVQTLLKSLNMESIHTDVVQKVSHYIQMLYDTQSLADERALLAFFLTHRQPLSDKQMQAWETIMERGGGASASTPSGHAEDDGSDQARDAQTIANRLLPIRGNIFEHADTSGFVTQLYDIENAFREPMNILERTQKKLLDDIDAILTQEKERNKMLFIELLVGMVILLILLYLLYRFLYTTKREQNALEESLREIVSELDAERRKELETIMRKGDRVAVYRFMADTTMAARAAEEHAMKAEKAKDIFLANMSHEIRTPLNGILGFAQLMQSTSLTAEQQEFMGVIEGSSSNLLKIVNDILDLSKIHAEKIELESIPLSLVHELEQAIEPHAARALERGIEYSTFIDPTMPRIKSDPTKITQIMANLIGNAVKFTNEGGTVDVDIRKIKENNDIVTVRFSIKDSGIGITPEQKERIFEPFSQADTSTTREFGGTGLGLAITREIIHHMGGTLKLVSEAGIGSEFFFELPFERAGEDDDIQNRLEGVTIAFYHAGQSTLRQMERNLALYARAMGARFRMVSDHELDLMDDVDVLLLDYSDRETRENIEKMLWLGKKTVLISTMTQKHETDNLSSRVDRIIYRPLTASKLIRVHESIDVVSAAPAISGTTAEAKVTLEALRILVAEDNPINQKLIGRVLEGMGIIPTLVDNGKEALEMRKAQEFDGILMDIQMPVMGGIESTQEILRYEHAQGAVHVPIIALTANALQGDRERYLREGFDNYISKPVNLDQLRQILTQHCAKPIPEEESPLQIERSDDDMLGLFPFYTVLMYSQSNGLVQRIHQDALMYAGHTFFSVSSEEGFIDALTTRHPDVVLIDTYSVELERCRLLDRVRENRVKLFIYGSVNPRLGCDLAQVTEYTSVSTLLSALR